MLPDKTVSNKRIIVQFKNRLNYEGKVEESPGRWVNTLWYLDGQNCEDPDWDFEKGKVEDVTTSYSN